MADPQPAAAKQDSLPQVELIASATNVGPSLVLAASLHVDNQIVFLRSWPEMNWKSLPSGKSCVGTVLVSSQFNDAISGRVRRMCVPSMN